ncbi:predicted protein [Plenodomus lingam JN3]|uniref:Predicted protein n=1 Tax=Leptosphaeria maculans (strain JN3 / isolate v23.1.3 / race Av1-4-5-6-7-8) TaxID=985895 RepID=E5AES9_LEPMJ|nr:predicted protein [Plenodomus lingam JN3]CBY01718.1 predicted protein [Plenodomus lingam JN3]
MPPSPRAPPSPSTRACKQICTRYLSPAQPPHGRPRKAYVDASEEKRRRRHDTDATRLVSTEEESTRAGHATCVYEGMCTIDLQISPMRCTGAADESTPIRGGMQGESAVLDDTPVFDSATVINMSVIS